MVDQSNHFKGQSVEGAALFAWRKVIKENKSYICKAVLYLKGIWKLYSAGCEHLDGLGDRRKA